MISKKQPTSRDEIQRLLGIVERDLQQADTPGLHPDGKFGFLYNAALQLATTVLRLNGLRVGQVAYHRATFQAVRDLVPANLQSEVDLFEHSRRKRNALTYDQAGVITRADISGLREAITAFESWVRPEAESYVGL
jgi:hypothetical protein